MKRYNNNRVMTKSHCNFNGITAKKGTTIFRVMTKMIFKNLQENGRQTESPVYRKVNFSITSRPMTLKSSNQHSIYIFIY